MKLAHFVAALAALSFLAGCVVAVPGVKSRSPAKVESPKHCPPGHAKKGEC